MSYTKKALHKFSAYLLAVTAWCWFIYSWKREDGEFGKYYFL